MGKSFWSFTSLLLILDFLTAPSAGLWLPTGHSTASGDHIDIDNDFFTELSLKVKSSINITKFGWIVVIPLTKREIWNEAIQGDPKFPKQTKACSSLEPLANQPRTLAMSCKGGAICLAGTGAQTRAASTISMIEQAANLLQQRGVYIHNFERKLISLDDIDGCDHDYTYTLPWDKSCKARLFPDFTFWKWPEAGLLPDFAHLTAKLQRIGHVPAKQHRCGWAGNILTNIQRKEFRDQANPSLFEVIAPKENQGVGNDRLTMEQQTEEWACMVDLPARGYSGRVPMLLHTGRPLLMIERRNTGHFTDRVWYADMLKPNIHYIPVHADLSDLETAAKKALSKEGLDIAANAQRLAAKELTTNAAIEHIAAILIDI